jgi:3-dehydroquinate synthase
MASQTKPEYVIRYGNGHVGPETSELFFHDRGADLSPLAAGKEAKLFVTDSTVAALPAIKELERNLGTHCLFVIPAGEEHKTIEPVLSIVSAALEHNLGRASVFCGIGGGVVTDMTAFASSIFKRGARLELVPTTLLAMADAAIGGKTGCDFGTWKNMIGTFYPAEKVHFYPELLSTLPEKEYRSGLAEVFKTALLFDQELYEQFEEGFDRDTLPEVIRACVEAKAWIVEGDPYEHSGSFDPQNLLGRYEHREGRMLLNFGHTFAHALESVVGLGTVTHGDAVAWGISRALCLSARLGLCSKAWRDEVYSLLNRYGWETTPLHSALFHAGLAQKDAAKRLVGAMKKDKKNANGVIRVILQREICDTLFQDVEQDEVLEVLR